VSRKNEAPTRKLIDHVAGADEVGSPSAFLATTFDLQPDFFESDYLPTLLRIPAWDDHRFRARVQLEAALAKTDAGVVLMEASRYQGRPRSLRLHLSPASSGNGGVLHAKVALIVHDDAVRLIVASANLTKSGYRENREVALSLVATCKRKEEGVLIQQALRAMPEVLAPWWNDAAARAVKAAQERLGAWDLPTASEDDAFVWGGSERALWQQLVAAWPEGEALTGVRVVSPFWSDEGDEGALGRLLRGLQARRVKTDGAKVQLVTAATPDTARSYLPTLPPSYGAFDFRGLGVSVTAVAAQPQVDAEDVGRDDILRERTLHAKVVILEGRTTSLAYLGSANFTFPGWGFGNAQRANIEAGVILRRTGKARAALNALVPPTAGEPVRLEGGGTVLLGAPEPDTVPVDWPAFMKAAEIRPDHDDPVGRVELSVRLGERNLPTRWSVALGPDVEPVFEGPARASDERVFRLDANGLQRLLRNQAIYLRWEGMREQGAVAFPINVSLPVRERLPFGDPEALPREQDLVAFYQGRIAFEDVFPPPADESHDLSSEGETGDTSTVDTSKILSYQVRSFVEALPGIRDELARNTGTASAIRLALLGPVSPVALAREIEHAVKSGRSATAACFQLVELLRCISAAGRIEVDARVREAWTLAVGEAASQIQAAVDRLRNADASQLGAATPFGRYASAVLVPAKGDAR
jgi:hypothetical protein